MPPPPARRATRTQRTPRATPSAGTAGRARWVALALPLAVFVVAWLWRVLYLARLARTPLAGSLVMDARSYWDWSEVLLRDGPLGHHAFFLGPLYPYVLAALRGVLGDSIPAVLQVQALWGAVAVALLTDAARRLTRPGVALVLGLLLAFYQAAVFFDGLVLMESLVFALEALLVWLVARGDWERAGPREFALLGALLALLAQGRATAALLVPVALLTLLRWRGGAARASGVRAAALLATFALLCAPTALRNRAVSGEWIPFTYNLGYNLYVGANPDANGSWGSITGTQQFGPVVKELQDGGAEVDGRAYLRATEGVDLGPTASSRRWAAKAAAYARAHPARVATLMLRRVAMMWNVAEYPQIENLDEFAALAGPLGLPWLGTFAVLGPLAFAGLWPAWRAGARGRFLVAAAIAVTLSVVPFFVTDRYRHHLVPVAAALAALALDAAWRAWRARDRAARLRMAALLAVGIVWVALPLPRLSGAGYAWGLAADLGARWMERGDPDRAAREFERALAMPYTQPAPGRASATFRLQRSALDHNYALALTALGRRDEALTWFERAVQEAPDHAATVHSLAQAYAGAGRGRAADSLATRLETLASGHAFAESVRGWIAVRAGDLAAAEAHFAAAVRLDATLYDEWGALVRVRVQGGRADAARAALAAGHAAGWSGPGYAVHHALIAALAGDAAGARAALDQVPAAALAADPALADVAKVTRGLLARAAPSR